MNIDTTGAYSKDKIYGQLTMPFANKPVVINAHTPYDNENSNSAVSRADFLKNSQVQNRYTIKDILENNGIKLDDSLKTDIGIVEMKEFPPESGLATFNLTNLQNNSDVALNAIKNGYMPDRSIVVAKAYRAYNTVNNHGNITKYLSGVSYTVS